MNQPLNRKKSIAPLTKLTPLPDFECVIWDVDGTILNSEPIHKLSVVRTLDEVGVEVDGDSVIQFLGKSHYDTYTKIIENSSYDREFDEFLDQCTNYYLDNLHKIELRQDVLDVIHMLDGQGIRQSIFSNNPGSIVFPTASTIEKKIGKKGFFEHIISLDGTRTFQRALARKPNPEGYNFALDLLETVAEKCLVIEDSPTGTKAGNGAGIFTLAWAHNNEDALIEAGADLVATGNLMNTFDALSDKNILTAQA